ncbi:MAG: draG [Neobacillus sp.]|nr:draG [Neobacillus sp.]
MKTLNERSRGCLIGGAIGDALGWPVEFMRLDEIKRKYGPQGITNLVKGRSNLVEITDDTQMTIFTAEGILRAENRGRNRGIIHIPAVIHRSYLRWLDTQGVTRDVEKDGWIYSIEGLHTRRAPGNTCLDALMSGKMGTMEEPINNSKGCGGVMRTAPVGLVYKKQEAFKLGCESAAITHGHPSGYLSAGILSFIIAATLEGLDLETAVEQSLEELKLYPSSKECSDIIEKAVTLAKSETPDIQAIKSLGEGWVGEEALAISVYCALKYQTDFEKAVITAVNHNGDSDSTGAITGNILGAYLGFNGIPQNWVSEVELSKELTQLADDLTKTYENSDEWHQKYPGW